MELSKISTFFPFYNTSLRLFNSSYQVAAHKIRWLHASSLPYENLRVCFVHTPMSSVTIPGRDEFWFNFDKRYYAVHPGLKLAEASIWELPHWMTWLGGVLKAEKFNNLKTLSLYTAVNLKEGINKDLIAVS
jgi:hypothetical protein